MKITRVAILGVCLAAILGSSLATAQTPDPRDYEVGYFVPSGTTIINAYLRHQSGTHGSDFSANAGAMRATYLIKFGDLVISPFDAILPIVDQTAYTPLGQTLTPFGEQFGALPDDLKSAIHASGVGDVVFLPSIGHGITEDAKIHTHTWYALTPYVTLPTGQYDPDHLLNVGRNRWAINPRIAIGQRFLRAITLEAMANVAFHGNNTAFRLRTPGFSGQDLVLQQKPSFGASAHLGVDLHRSFFVGAAYYVAVAGQSYFSLATLNGVQNVEVGPSTKTHSMRINFGLRMTPTTLLQVQWSEDLAGSAGASLGRFFGLRLTHLFFQDALPKGEHDAAASTAS